MKHTLRGLATVNYFAADHAAAKQWYTDFLGIKPYFERPGYVEFRLGDYQHELGIIDGKYVPGTESADGRAGVVVYWHVDDIDAVLKKQYRWEQSSSRHHKTAAMGSSPLR
jgi:predicted enzyme related to lactoylglutathione lyase